MATKATRTIPDGYRTVTPYLVVPGAATALDPFGHQRTISTHIEDVTPDETRERMKRPPPPTK